MVFTMLVASEHGMVPGGHYPSVKLGRTASTKADPARLPHIIFPSITEISTAAIGSMTWL